MSDDKERNGLTRKTTTDQIVYTVVHNVKIHWYRFDPNRPTFDQLRAIDIDRKRRASKESRLRISESMLTFFRRFVPW